MFTAYSLSTIAGKLPLGLESICSQGRTLYCGTKNGSLVTYAYSPDQQRYNLYVCKNFLSKPVSQIKFVSEFKIVLALSDGILSVHDSTAVNYPVILALQKTKNINFFTADVIVNNTVKQIQEKRLLCVCAVARRKIFLYYWHDKELVELPHLFDVAYADNVRSAVWCPEGRLGLAIRDEYFLLTVFGSATSVDEEELPGNNRYLFTTGNKSIMPIIKPLNDLKIIGFCRDETMYFVTCDGRSAEGIGYAHIRWSQIPNSIEYDYPFLLALFNSSIEIRSLRPSQLVQTLDVQKPHLISWGCRTCLHVASNPSANLIDLYCLDAGGPLLRQNIQQLIKDKEYQLASQLAENIFDDKSDEEKRNRLTEIRTLHAFHLFCQRRFSEAMRIFGDINAEVLYVVGLFPDLLPDEVRKRVAYPGPLPSDFAKNDFIQGLHALAEYLSMVRTNIARQLDANEKRKNKFFGSDSGSNVKQGAYIDDNAEIQLKNLLQIVDTTLLKCYLQTNEMLVASLLRLPDNRCDVPECEKILLKLSRFNDLFLLYERKGLHEKALELLRSQYKRKDSALKDLSRSVHYLHNLGSKNLPLILKFSSWIFKEDATEGLKIFTEDCEEVKSLDRRTILDFLLRESSDSVVPYLEHVINVFQEERPYFKDALVQQCFRMVKNAMPEYIKSLVGHSMAPAGKEPAPLGEMRQKLLNYLDLSSSYNAEVLLNELPENIMQEERAILLGKAGKHAQAISMYTNVLHDFKKAEEYCIKYHQVSQKSSSAPSGGTSNLFLLMLSSYAKPGDGVVTTTSCPKPPNVRLALKVLQDYAPYVDVAEALRLLPTDVRFEELWIALEAVLHSIARKKSDAQIKSSLLYSLLLLTHKQRIKAQNVKISINYDSACSICSKRIGSSAFVRLQNHSLLHYYCLPSCNDDKIARFQS